MKKMALMALVVLQATALSACNINVNGGGKAVKATAASAEERQQVDAATQRILAQLDSGRYGSAWDSAGPILRNSGTQGEFEKQLRLSRKLVKDWRSRALIATTFHDVLPGVAPGRYAAVNNEVECGKARCTEELVLQHVDGAWMLAGYNVHKTLRVSL
jgi:predicted small secreted protein